MKGFFTMTFTTAWIFLLVAIIFNTLGNLFLKYAGTQQLENRLEVFFTLPFLLGGFFFGVNLLAYTQAQVGLPISVSYPVLVGLSIIGVSLGAVFYFDEIISIRQLIGMGVIFLGVLLVSNG